MIARAPGKIVVSGAYSVLEGAPAVVVAVDRYVTADTARDPSFVTPEVKAAIGSAKAPWFDASPLRDAGRKLGLGSSAAILVASLAALESEVRGELDDETLSAVVLQMALRAHREAQGGGTGVDVAASCHGGTIVAERRGPMLSVTRSALPAGLHLEVWATGRPASTPMLLSRVERMRVTDPARHKEVLGALGLAAVAGAQALREGSALTLLAALRDQCARLDRLGHAIRAPIVTDAVRMLNDAADSQGAVVLPSGAGGGDIALFAGIAPPTHALIDLARRHGHVPLDLKIEARGVHCMQS